MRKGAVSIKRVERSKAFREKTRKPMMFQPDSQVNTPAQQRDQPVQQQTSPTICSLLTSPARVTRSLLNSSIEDQPQLPQYDNKVKDFSNKLDLYNRIKLVPIIEDKDEDKNEDEEVVQLAQSSSKIFDDDGSNAILQNLTTKERKLRPRKQKIDYKAMHSGK